MGALVDDGHRVERTFRSRDFREAPTFVQRSVNLPNPKTIIGTSGLEPGYATASLRTKRSRDCTRTISSWRAASTGWRRCFTLRRGSSGAPVSVIQICFARPPKRIGNRGAQPCRRALRCARFYIPIPEVAPAVAANLNPKAGGRPASEMKAAISGKLSRCSSTWNRIERHRPRARARSPRPGQRVRGSRARRPFAARDARLHCTVILLKHFRMSDNERLLLLRPCPNANPPNISNRYHRDKIL
jgi:hypothetical protein